LTGCFLFCYNLGIMPSGIYLRKPMSEDWRRKISQSLSGNKNHSGHTHSAEVRKKISERSKENPARFWLGKKRLHMTGEKHPNWVADRSKLKTGRSKAYDTKYKYWMLEVKKRDGWKCKISNEGCSGRLEAHHILDWTSYPELRYTVSNGITLCHSHHPRKRSDEAELSPFFQQLVTNIN